jgi:hypothetical protein
MLLDYNTIHENSIRHWRHEHWLGMFDSSICLEVYNAFHISFHDKDMIIAASSIYLISA